MTTVRMEELPRPSALTCTPDETLEAVGRRMRQHDVSALAVVKGGYVVGMISTLGLVGAIADGADMHSAVVRSYSVPVYDVALPGEDTRRVARRMLQIGVEHIPVVDGATVTNVVPLRQLVAVRERPTAPTSTPACGVDQTGEDEARDDDGADISDDDWALQFGDAAGWLEPDASIRATGAPTGAPCG